MKTVYIPKGETVTYESLVTDHLVVKGCLKTAYGIKAKHISGNGVISAGEISADTIRARDIEAAAVICRRLIAERVSASEVMASDSAAVSCFLSAAYVETGKLTVAMSEIDELKAEEVVNLHPRKRGMLRTLLASALRSFWLSLTSRAEKAAAIDAVVEPSESEMPETEPEAAPSVDPAMKDEIARTVREILENAGSSEPISSSEGTDFELNRFVSIFRLCRDSGYTLRVVPGTPEENAPVFDFEDEHILRPAA